MRSEERNGMHPCTDEEEAMEWFKSITDTDDAPQVPMPRTVAEHEVSHDCRGQWVRGEREGG